MMTRRTARVLVPAAISFLSLLSVATAGPAGMHHAGAAPSPIHITMEQLHANGGVPSGWKFLMPPGNPDEGRKVFVAMECFACHQVKGEDFPRASRTPQGTGPDLTGMGSHHPAEYFAESILSPNRVVVEGPGYAGPDGLSKMPDYADSMTVKQLVDVVAYLKSLVLTTGSEHMEHGSMKMHMH
jgi:mono/diheme cytochrome c family protein